MSKLIILLVALFGVAYSAPSLDGDNAESNNGLQDPIANLTELTYIGDYAGKAFYLEITNTANIDDAKAVCDRFRFSLLTLGSRQEFDWLRARLANNQRYWTSGKDTATYRWDLGAGQIVDKTTYNVNIWHHICLVIYGSYELIAEPCNGSLGHSYHTICQNRIAK